MLTPVSPSLLHVITGTTRPRSLMVSPAPRLTSSRRQIELTFHAFVSQSIFMYYNGLRPGLERPGKVLIHQLDSSHPPK